MEEPAKAKHGFIRIAAFLAACIATEAVWAIGEFYGTRAEGWFWYQTNQAPVEDERREQPEDMSAPLQGTQSDHQDPVPLSVEWLRENLPKYRDAAIDNPTPASIAAYLYLQKVMLDKSSRFADSVQQAVVMDPHLDEVTRRPLATFAANEMNKQAAQARENQLRAIAARAGIFFFFLSDCPYCHVQAPILARLADLYGFQVYPVSLDGRPMPNGLFQDFRTDRGQAQQLGVVSTPAMFLAHPPGKFVQIAQGAISMEELVSRILLAAVQAGWLEENEYQKSRAFAVQATLDKTRVPANALSDPAKLVDYFRNSIRSMR